MLVWSYFQLFCAKVMNSNVYRWCTVSQCHNTSIKTPSKLFFNVPKEKMVRNKQLNFARRSSYVFKLCYLFMRRPFQMTLGFFDDILIPPSALQHPSKFNETEQAWVWEYDTGDGDKHDLFMDVGEKIRFRVTAELFKETCPAGPNTLQETQENQENKVPYSLTGSINEPGLGLLTWWDN